MSETFDTFSWIPAACILVLGGLVAVSNWSVCFSGVFRKQGGSITPLFGGIMLCIGIACLPFEGTWKWAWLGLILDFGSLPMFVWTAISKSTNSNNISDN